MEPNGLRPALWPGLARLPQGLGWGAIIGGGCLCGVGFTMALFITELALGEDLVASAKIGVRAGSVLRRSWPGRPGGRWWSYR